MAAKLRKGDEVIVLAGKDKGKKGTVTWLCLKLARRLLMALTWQFATNDKHRLLKVGVCPKQCLLIFQTYL